MGRACISTGEILIARSFSALAFVSLRRAHQSLLPFCLPRSLLQSRERPHSMRCGSHSLAAQPPRSLQFVGGQVREPFDSSRASDDGHVRVWVQIVEGIIGNSKELIQMGNLILAYKYHAFLVTLHSLVGRLDQRSVEEHLLKMFEVPTDNTATPKQHESGPNYFAFYKHLVLNLLSQDGKCIIPFTEVDSAGSVGKCFGSGAERSHNGDRKVNYFSGSGSYFTKAFGEGLSEFKKERLLATLNESAICLNREADEVYNNIQALQGKKEICHEDVEKHTFQLLAKLDKMEENLDEYLNVVVSSCRPMTRIEKHRLGKDIRKLPAKALNRVVEILQPSNSSATDFPESIVVNLEEQDNVKLWRLYYYVELVLKASKI